MSEISAKEATCVESGNGTYWVCSSCNKLFSDANALTEITLEDTVIEKHEHSMNPEWKVNETSHWKECVNCGLKEDESTHTYSQWAVNKNATAAETESEERICSVCGYIETKFILATSDKIIEERKSPQTGDTSTRMVWFALVAVSLSMLFGIKANKE